MLFACLAAGLWKNYTPSFHETWWRGESWAKHIIEDWIIGLGSLYTTIINLCSYYTASVCKEICLSIIVNTSTNTNSSNTNDTNANTIHINAFLFHVYNCIKQAQAPQASKKSNSTLTDMVMCSCAGWLRGRYVILHRTEITGLAHHQHNDSGDFCQHSVTHSGTCTHRCTDESNVWFSINNNVTLLIKTNHSCIIPDTVTLKHPLLVKHIDRRYVGARTEQST